MKSPGNIAKITIHHGVLLKTRILDVKHKEIRTPPNSVSANDGVATIEEGVSKSLPAPVADHHCVRLPNAVY